MQIQFQIAESCSDYKHILYYGWHVNPTKHYADTSFKEQGSPPILGEW